MITLTSLRLTIEAVELFHSATEADIASWAKLLEHCEARGLASLPIEQAIATFRDQLVIELAEIGRESKTWGMMLAQSRLAIEQACSELNAKLIADKPEPPKPVKPEAASHAGKAKAR